MFLRVTPLKMNRGTRHLAENLCTCYVNSIKSIKIIYYFIEYFCNKTDIFLSRTHALFFTLASSLIKKKYSLRFFYTSYIHENYRK